MRSERSAEGARGAGAGETVHAELGDGTSLAEAGAGLDTLVFIAPPFDADEEAHAANALDAASEVGIGHFVYYSVLHANLPGLPHHLRKLSVEARVHDSDLHWTVVQPAMYQQSLLDIVRGATDGVVRLPYSPEARFTLVDLVDVAEVVGRICAEPDDHIFASYELAGPEAMPTSEMVRRIGEVTNTELRVEQIPLTEWALPPGLPPIKVAEMIAMAAKYDRRGHQGNPTVLRHLLGREPTPLTTTARRELTAEP